MKAPCFALRQLLQKERLLLLERNRVLANDRLEIQLRMADSRLGTIQEERGRFHEELRLLKRRVARASQHLPNSSTG